MKYVIYVHSVLFLFINFIPHLLLMRVAGKTLLSLEKQLLLVANAHMHWDPEYSDVKLVQTMMFLSEVKNIVDKASRSLKLSSISGETNAIPLVLCADLNSLPDSGLSSVNDFNASAMLMCIRAAIFTFLLRVLEFVLCVRYVN